jgi:hypothetical protein
MAGGQKSNGSSLRIYKKRQSSGFEGWQVDGEDHLSAFLFVGQIGGYGREKNKNKSAKSGVSLYRLDLSM